MSILKFIRKSQRQGSFAVNVALTIATNIFIAGLTVITGLLAARLLHPEGRGQLAAIQVFPSFVATLAMLGLWESVVYISSSRHSEAGRALGSAVLLTLLAGPMFGLLAYLTLPWILSAQEPRVVAAARWYLLLIPIYSLLFMPLHALRAGKSLVAWNLVRILPTLGWLSVLALAWTTKRANPQWISAAFLTCLAALILPSWIIARAQISRPIWPDRKLFVSMLRYGIPSAAGTIPQTLNLRLDQMLMSAMLPAQFLGLYVVAVAWSSAVSPITSAVAQPLLPRVASQPSEEARIAALAQVLRITVAVSAALAMCVCLGTPILIPKLFGSDFAVAVPCGIVLVIAAAFSGINYVVQEGMRGLADTPAVFLSETAGLLVTALSLLLLLPTLRIMGAAIASLLGYATTTVFLLTRLCMRSGAPIAVFVFPGRRDIELVLHRITSAWSSANVAPTTSGSR